MTILRAKIPQPVATWFDWGLDNDGQWIRGNEALTAPTLVIDQGFNTFDVLVVQQGQISRRHTGGDTLGMRRAAELLRDSLRRKFNLRPELVETDALIRRVAQGQKVAVFVQGESVDVSAEAKQALRTLEAQVTAFLEKVMHSGQQYRVLLTGGGALAMRNHLFTQFPNAIMPHNPILANACGLAKLAQRPGFLD